MHDLEADLESRWNWTHRLGQSAVLGALAAGVVFGRAGFGHWAVVTCGLLVGWLAWLAVAVARGKRTFAGNPALLPVLGLGAIFAGHVLWTQFVYSSKAPRPFGGVEMSLLTHVLLLGLAVLLTGALFPRPARGWLAVLAVVLGGAAYWLPDTRLLWLALPSSLAGLAVGLKRLQPRLSGAVAVAGFAVFAAVLARPLGNLPEGWTFLGRGEFSLGPGYAADPGIVFLAGTAGCAGVLAVLVLIGLALWWAWCGRPERPWLAGLWTAGTLLATGALLVEGGWTSPASFAAAALAWGLLPGMVGREVKQRPAWWLAGVLGVFLLLANLARSPGLPASMAGAMGLNDKAVHFTAGLLLTAVLGWCVGAKRGWVFWAALVGVACLGVLGEMLQKLLTARSIDSRDAEVHLLGVLAGAVLMVPALWVQRVRLTGRNTPRNRRRQRRLGVVCAMLMGLVLLGWAGGTARCVIGSQETGLERLSVSDGVVSSGLQRCPRLFDVTRNPRLARANLLLLRSPQGPPLRSYQSLTRGKYRVWSVVWPIPNRPERFWAVADPFSSMAWDRQRCLWVPLARDQCLLLIDSRLLDMTAPSESLMGPREARPDVQTGILYVGSGQDYRSFRNRLRRSLPDTPCIVYLSAPKTPELTLKLISYWMAEPVPLILVTEDPDLRRFAQRRWPGPVRFESFQQKPTATNRPSD
jgi:VanZ family protein